ncbi:MAG: ABC-type nitrate/sulfonate/bicarbonate transport system, permease component [Candidatus Magasanikbacteria bacterium GW2011_GWC2_37_14]|uniref:ABC-type nitrate/sulfonate/bicarbonate transport system, permease component n=1 Tax=Candidatus Magasanikbacteria bacterium GW2011_GWC2_37_14 TaxID=1619046 RepID=A0A0G0IVT0_9BACT|nr:MAG: ABC-type nitrate/sulfonate/bicarbonate transport system, permease component [Candidatus Magasanikbacteria bacterium GW2011_GWC2_37_14]
MKSIITKLLQMNILIRDLFYKFMLINDKEKMYGKIMVAVGFLVLLIVWFVLSYIIKINRIFLPTPLEVSLSLWNLIVSGKFFINFLYSFVRIFLATLISVLIGVPLGILIGYSFNLRKLMLVVTEPMRYLPITALIPLLILWLGIGEPMKIIFLVVGIVFYLISMVSNSVQQIKKEYLLVARDFCLSTKEMILKVIWPASLPQIWDSIIVVNGIGWTYMVLAEIINARNGLGYMISIAGRLQRSDEVFASLLLLTLVALSLDKILRFIKGKYFNW